MRLEEWLDDLCVRFIINLPPEELQSVERICFQVEEAQWFYEDFIRPLDPSLPSLSLRAFSLRIFQHCPLFSQWSEQHHVTAFAEFLAYKSRVPVRGAILLSEAMDEVVLVKGWKKSANWSFPRGKINKDENDLDCAVREVYEETGFDAREAGLVQDEKDMKYIEITMREQHMKLFVFRGVPRDTHFEPKTRKEISKIEWYKLADLPTLKKNRQHEGSGTDHTPINANKFYMVAPFLNPLKKWITLQRKKENRYSSHLAAPPIVPEDLTTEEERDIDGLVAKLPITAPVTVSDLPEVSVPPLVDPTAHLKEMLRIGTQPVQPQPVGQLSHIPQVDAEKSNALLALLRGKQQGFPGIVPETILGQISMPPEAGPPHTSHVQEPPLDKSLPLPPSLRPFPQNQAQPRFPPSFQNSQAQPVHPNAADYVPQSAPPIAPYQRFGDPLSVPQGVVYQPQAAVPPASALPKLTNHTKALLDVFKGPAGALSSSPAPIAMRKPDILQAADRSHFPQVPRPDVSNLLGLSSQIIQGTGRGFAPLPSINSPQSTTAFGGERPIPSLPSSRPTQSAQKASLLQLFNQPSTPKIADPLIAVPAPFELPATAAPSSSEKPSVSKDELLLTLLRQGNVKAPQKAAAPQRPIPREGETAATVNGPLNQPAFEVITRSAKHAGNEMGRSAVSATRTLYDPNAPAQVKILTRPEEARPQPPRSPRGLKPISKRPAKDKATPKEPPKPFQPQILRRPQSIEVPSAGVPLLRTEDPAQQPVSTAASTSSPAVSDNGTIEKLTPSRKSSHTDVQKQKLLSLFGGGLDTTPKTTALQPGPGIVSPLTASQLMSANGEGALSAVEPISTRTSRVGSIGSMVSGATSSRPIGEKRQTGVENKAFLLGYLGRIATQEQ